MQRVLHIDLPISVGLLAAYAGSVYAYLRGAHGFMYFDFVSTFTFLMLVGRWLQEKAVERNRAQLLASQNEPPPVRTVPGHEQLPIAELAPGMRFALEPGQVAPVRSTLRSEAAMLGLEWINGESEAALAPHGRIVSAGAVNCGQAAIELEALERWDDSLLRKLLHVAPPATARNERLERFIRRYIVVVLGIAAIAFAGWWAYSRDLLSALQVLVSVLVVSCPCASGVALPLCSDLAASRLRKHGVFLRDPEMWARLQRVRKIVFDKTGTLTLEGISLRNPKVLRQLTARDRSALLALVSDSPHPVSGCLREQLLADRVPPAQTAESPRETVGFGVEAELDGVLYRLGRPEWAVRVVANAEVQSDGKPSRSKAFGSRSDVDGLTDDGAGDCVFSRGGEVLARFSFGEEARSDAAEEIAALQGDGRDVYILSGDRRAKVEAMANRLGLPLGRCLAELSPVQKAEWIGTADRRDTLYLGDGANDSLAFDRAWCTGTPAVDRGLLEQKAGFYFLGRGLAGLRALLEMSRRRTATAHRVVAFAISYNVVAIALCVAGQMNPLMAAILMPASSLVSLGLVFAGLREPRAR
jgi:Cu2+-exporting ATPase